MAEEWALGLHRAILIQPGPGECRALLHDDFHHFHLIVSHDGQTVTAVRARTLRGPYSLCPRAGDELTQLVGLPLVPATLPTSRAVTLRHQCTHQFELAALAIAAAARGQALRYDLAVEARDHDSFHGTVARDGARLLDWQVEADLIASPADIAGRALGIGFSQWAAEALPPDLAEAALVLRRGFILARARRHVPRLDSLRSALANGNCWVQQPERADSALRLRGVVRDYSGGTVPVDQADRDWLAAVA